MVNYVLSLNQWKRFFQSIAHPNFQWYGSVDSTIAGNNRFAFNNFTDETVFAVRRSGVQTVSFKTGYTIYQISSTDNYQLTNPAGSPRHDSLTFTNLAKARDGTQRDTFGGGTYTIVYIVAPNHSAYSVADFRSRLQTLSSGGSVSDLFPRARRAQTDKVWHLNDFSNRKLAYLSKKTARSLSES